jgi:hypothetical protein
MMKKIIQSAPPRPRLAREEGNETKWGADEHYQAEWKYAQRRGIPPRSRR